MMNLKSERDAINATLSDYRLVDQRCTEEQMNLCAAEDLLVDLQDAQEIAQNVAQTVQQQAHSRISRVVTSCLRTVFDGEDDYGFKIRFERKRGRTEAVLLLTKNGYEIEDVLDGDSGGVVDIASFALRLACIVLSKPRLRKLVVLDEPFKFVSKGYRDNVRRMLEGLAKDFGVQFIMVTHIDELEIGKVVRL